MPYIYVGNPSIYQGRRLFQILCQLKNFGQGRIVYRSEEQNHPEPSFYRILLAQPEMDDRLENGRVVTERVYRGKRRKEPVVISRYLRILSFLKRIYTSGCGSSIDTPSITLVVN